MDHYAAVIAQRGPHQAAAQLADDCRTKDETIELLLVQVARLQFNGSRGAGVCEECGLRGAHRTSCSIGALLTH
jgi:hypothetical protein